MPFSWCLWLVLSTAALCQDVRHKYVVYRGSAGPRYPLKGENPCRIRRAAFLIPLHPGCCLGESGFSNWGVRFPDTFRLRGWWCGSGDLRCHLPQLNENILWESGQQLVLVTCLGMADIGSPCASFLCHLSATTQPCRQLPTCSPGSQASEISVFYLPHLFFFHLFFIQCSKLQRTRTIIIFFLHRWSKHMHVHPGPGCHLVATPSGQPVVPLHCDGLVRMIQDRLSPSLLSTWKTSYLVRYTKEEEFNHIEDSWVTLLKS